MTAFTRLCTDSSQASPSFWKIEWITFSTDRSVRKSAAAIAALFFPSAISRSTSRSRGVSSASGDSSAFDFAATSASTTFGSTTEPPAATTSIASTSWSTSSTRSLRRYARCAVPASSSAKAHRRLDALIRSGRRHPDVRHDDVGALGVDGREERREIAARRDDLHLGMRLEKLPHAFSDEIVILREDQPDRHA